MGRVKGEGSYEAYLRKYYEWEEKGYRMRGIMNREAFKAEFSRAKRAGRKNIAREFASESREFSYREGRNIVKELKEVNPFIVGSVKEILNLSAKEISERTGIPLMQKYKRTLRNGKTIQGEYKGSARQLMYLYLKQYGLEAIISA